MTTQETVHNNITDKLSKLSDIRDIFAEISISFDNETDAITKDYISAITPIYAGSPAQYNTVLVQHNIIGKIDCLEQKYRNKYNELVIIYRTTAYDDKIKAIMGKLRDKLDVLERMRQIHNHHLRKKKKTKEIKTCSECKTQMDLILHLSEYRCPKCHFKKTAHGYVPADIYLDYTTTSRNTSNYKQEENCIVWLNKLQGIDNKDIPQTLITRLNELAIRDKAQLPHKKTCRRIRVWLKELEETSYNNHAAKIKYMMTGIIPEQLSSEEKETVKRYFPSIMTEYNKVKPSNRKNSCYQPHIILKILEQKIDRSTREKEERFLRIVSNIHFQDDETILKNDQILQTIFPTLGLDFEITKIGYYAATIE